LVQNHFDKELRYSFHAKKVNIQMNVLLEKVCDIEHFVTFFLRIQMVFALHNSEDAMLQAGRKNWKKVMNFMVQLFSNCNNKVTNL